MLVPLLICASVAQADPNGSCKLCKQLLEVDKEKFLESCQTACGAEWRLEDCTDVCNGPSKDMPCSLLSFCRLLAAADANSEALGEAHGEKGKDQIAALVEEVRLLKQTVEELKGLISKGQPRYNANIRGHERPMPPRVHHDPQKPAERAPVTTKPTQPAGEQFTYRAKSRAAIESSTAQENSSPLCLTLFPVSLILVATFAAALRVYMNGYFEKVNDRIMNAEDLNLEQLGWVAFQEKVYDLTSSFVSLILLGQTLGFHTLLFAMSFLMGSPEALYVEMSSPDLALSFWSILAIGMLTVRALMTVLGYSIGVRLHEIYDFLKESRWHSQLPAFLGLFKSLLHLCLLLTSRNSSYLFVLFIMAGTDYATILKRLALLARENPFANIEFPITLERLSLLLDMYKLTLCSYASSFIGYYSESATYWIFIFLLLANASCLYDLFHHSKEWTKKIARE